MTTHELARKLLEDPDVLVVVNDGRGDFVPVRKTEVFHVKFSDLHEYDLCYEVPALTEDNECAVVVC
jgi:hypothetical protein